MQKSELLAKIEQKDHITSNHCCKTSNYALQLGSVVGLNEDDLSLLEISAALHDVGKINVPDVILMKPSSLTPDEYDIIKNHSVWGAEIIEQFFTEENAALLAETIRHHHERYDGEGYPDGLKGDDIPFFSQIIAVADAYDAMTSDRNYRKAMEKEIAVDILKKESGKQFHPYLVTLFAGLIMQSLSSMNFAK